MQYLLPLAIALVALLFLVRPAVRVLEYLLYGIEKEMLMEREQRIDEQFKEVNRILVRSLIRVRKKLGLSDL